MANTDRENPRRDTRISLLNRNISQVSDRSRNRINIEELREELSNGDFRRGFSMIDENRDGQIDIHELKRLFRSLNYKKIPYDIMLAITKCDEDQNGYLNYEEFVEMFKHPTITRQITRYIGYYVDTIIPRQAQYYDMVDGYDEVDGLYEMQYKLWPPPVGMILTSVLIIALYIVDANIYGNNQGAGPVAKEFIYDPRKRDEFWRFLTYMFVHVGESHLCVNVIMMILLGVPFEMVQSGLRVLSIFMFGVIAGSLGTSLVDPYTLLAGASGGVYCLLAAHISNIILNFREMSSGIYQLIFFLTISIFDIGSAIYDRYYLKRKTNVGYTAHLAGAFAGLMVGILLLKNLKWNSWENRLWWIAVVIFVAFMMFAILWNIYNPGYYPS